MMEDIKSHEKRALRLKKMWEEKVKRDEEALEARSRGISEKMPKAADEETESNAEEETEDESSAPTLVCTFLECIFKVLLIMCWLRRRLPQTQGRWRRQRAPRKRTTTMRRAGVLARGPGLPAGGTVPADDLQ